MLNLKKKFLEFAELTLRSDDILQINYLNDVPVSLNEAQLIKNEKIKIVGEQAILVLYTTNNPFVVPSEEVIKFFQSETWLHHTIANAFVLTALSQKLAFRSERERVEKPTAYFPTTEEAIEWLYKQK